MRRPRSAATSERGLVAHSPRGKLQRMNWAGLTLRLAARAAVNPPLAADLVRVAWRFRANGWYRRFPFLPLPSRKYVRWRMHTAYGEYDSVPPVEDVVRYARWAGRAK